MDQMVIVYFLAIALIPWGIGLVMVRTISKRVPKISRLVFFMCVILLVIIIYAVLPSMGMEFLEYPIAWLSLPILGIGRSKSAGRGFGLARIIAIPFVGDIAIIALLVARPVPPAAGDPPTAGMA